MHVPKQVEATLGHQQRAAWWEVYGWPHGHLPWLGMTSVSHCPWEWEAGCQMGCGENWMWEVNLLAPQMADVRSPCCTGQFRYRDFSSHPPGRHHNLRQAGFSMGTMVFIIIIMDTWQQIWRKKTLVFELWCCLKFVLEHLSISIHGWIIISLLKLDIWGVHFQTHPSGLEGTKVTNGRVFASSGGYMKRYQKLSLLQELEGQGLNQRLEHLILYGGSLSHGGTPITGWFISWKIRKSTWMIWRYPFQETSISLGNS